MGERTVARNRTILWILMDTGMRASELCGLHLWDVNREQKTLRVEGRGKERWLGLSPKGWDQVLCYLEQYRPKNVRSEGGTGPRSSPVPHRDVRATDDQTPHTEGLPVDKNVRGEPIHESYLQVRFLVTQCVPPPYKRVVSLQTVFRGDISLICY